MLWKIILMAMVLNLFQALMADCIARREHLERLEEKAAHVNDAHPQSRVLDLRSRYSAVTSAMKDIVAKLDGQVGVHEDYRKAYIGCLDWMANTRHRLQRLSDFSGDCRTLQDRLQQLKVGQSFFYRFHLINEKLKIGYLLCFLIFAKHT